MDDVDAPGMGDNRPPEEVSPLLERLAEDYGASPEGTRKTLADIAKRLLEAEARIPASLTEETVGRAGDYVLQIKKLLKRAEKARIDEKEPFLESCRTVDGFFAQITGSAKKPNPTGLYALIERVESRIGAYLKAQELAERQKRLAEARELEQEAKKLRAEGARDLANETLADARELREEARTATPGDLVKTSSGLGATMTLRRKIAFEITDKQAAAAALARHIPDEVLATAIRAFCRAEGITVETLDTQPLQRKLIPGVTLMVEREGDVRG